MGRSAAGCRQLAARARRRIGDRRQRFDADVEHGRELTRAFLLACGTGDLDGLRGLLADDVVLWTDGGGKVRAAMRPVVGSYRSSRFLVNVTKRLRGVPRDVVLNGQPGAVVIDDGSVVASIVLDILDRRIVGIRVVTNPDKLALLTTSLAE